MSFYRDQLNEWLKTIDVKAESVLDVGGGQDPVRRKVKSWQVQDYKILDNDAQFKPDIFHDMNQPLIVEDEFDIIFCLEVAEYIWNPFTFHCNLAGLLKENGVLYISYGFWYPLHNPPGIDYLRYTKNAIEKLLSESGFETWEIKPRIATHGLRNLHDFIMNEGMRAMKDTNQIYDLGYMVCAYKKGIQ